MIMKGIISFIKRNEETLIFLWFIGIAFLGFLITMLINAVKFVLNSTDKEQIIYIAVSIIAIWAVMFHGLVDTIYFRPQLQFMFWTYVAVISTLLSSKMCEV